MDIEEKKQKYLKNGLARVVEREVRR